MKISRTHRIKETGEIIFTTVQDEKFIPKYVIESLNNGFEYFIEDAGYKTIKCSFTGAPDSDLEIEYIYSIMEK